MNTDHKELMGFKEAYDVVYPQNSAYSVLESTVSSTLLSITPCDSRQYRVQRSSVSDSSSISVFNAIPRAQYVAPLPWAPTQVHSVAKHLSNRLVLSRSICSRCFSFSRMRHNCSHLLPTSCAKRSWSSWDTTPGLNCNWAVGIVKIGLPTQLR